VDFVSTIEETDLECDGRITVDFLNANESDGHPSIDVHTHAAPEGKG
jgi:hypothetical protein